MNLYDNYNNPNNVSGDEPLGNNQAQSAPQQSDSSGYQPQFSQPTGGAGSYNSAGSGGPSGQPPQKKTGARTTAIIAVCLAGGLALGGTVGYFSGKDKSASVVAETEMPQQETEKDSVSQNFESSQPENNNSEERAFSVDESTKTLAGDQRQPKASTEIYQEVGPSIVTVTSRYTVMQGNQSANATGNGSGIIISDEGYVLTNNHVVSGSESLTVTTSDGEEHEAELIGRDSKTDLAVLKFDNSDGKYSAAALGSSDEVVVGETVFAIGNPLGELATSMTNGMVSAVNRSIDMNNEERGNVTMNFIQMTAAISPGNSGGALINAYGEVIGVTTAKSYGEAVEGIGYAIPIDDAKPVIEELINHGYVTGRPTIGISGQDINDEMAQLINVPEGVYVAAVTDNSPAAKAGMKVGDIIVSVNGNNVASVEEINEIKNQHKAGDTLTLEIYRKGEKMNVDIILGEEQPDQQQSTDDPSASTEEQYPGGQLDPNDFYNRNQVPDDMQEFFDSIFGSGY